MGMDDQIKGSVPAAETTTKKSSPSGGQNNLPAKPAAIAKSTPTPPDFAEYMKQYNAYMAACYTNSAWQAAAAQYYNAYNYYAAASAASDPSNTASAVSSSAYSLPSSALGSGSIFTEAAVNSSDAFFTNGVVPVKPGETSCNICNIHYTDTKLLQVHLVSKRHLKNLEKQKSMPAQSTEILCDICNLTCYNQDMYNVHIQSEGHLMKQQEAYIRAQTAAYCASALPYYNVPAGQAGKSDNSTANKDSKSSSAAPKDSAPQKKKMKA